MLRKIKDRIPTAWKHIYHRCRILLQEALQEIAFDCQSALRHSKKERLQTLSKLEDFFEFASKEFWVSQNPREYLPFLRFLQERNPMIVGEIGTFMSGGSFLFTRVFTRLTLLLAVDLHVKNKSKLRFYAPADLEVVCVDGFSCNPHTLHQVSRALGDRFIDFLFIDGDHEYAGVRQDLMEYAKWIRPGGLVGFHDIIPDHFVRYGRPGPFYAGEVYLLWRQLKNRFRHWEFIDDPEQNGAGIGVIELDDQTAVKLAEIARLKKDEP